MDLKEFKNRVYQIEREKEQALEKLRLEFAKRHVFYFNPIGITQNINEELQFLW